MKALAVLALLAACVGAGPSRAYPRWVVDVAAPEPVWRGCAGVRAFVRKSGKQGIGVTIELRSRTDCDVTIPHAVVVLDDGTRAPGELLPVAPLRGRSLVYLWMPARFDGDAAWNAGVRRGRLELGLAIDGAPQAPIVLPLAQRWNGPFEAEPGGAR